MGWWPFGRNRQDGAAAGAGPTADPAAPSVAAPPVSLTAAEPEGAWRDLPSVQRTLAEPLHPVAIGEDFPQSLASFTNPSFVAPLSHQVDPSTGGLVDGLASPGQPYAHPNGSDLPVPARPAASNAPRVQRSVAWSGSSDLPTVGWELPGWSNEGLVEPSPESPPVTIGGVEPTTSGTAPVATSVAAAASAPVRGGATTPQAQVPVQRSLAAVPERPAPMGVVSPIALGELPVVARSTAEASTFEVRPTPDLSAAPETPVDEIAEPTEQAPLSGFAAAITSLTRSGEPVEPPDGRAGGGGSEDRLAGAPSVQRLTAEVEAPIRSDIVPDASDAAVPSAAPSGPSPSSPSPGAASSDPQTLAPPLTGSMAVSALPVVSRLVGTSGPGGPNLSARAVRAPTGSDPGGRVPDAPTLGHEPAQTALAIQRAPLSGRTAVSAEPPVQRVEFLTPQIAAGARPALSRIPAVPAAAPEAGGVPSPDRVSADSGSVVAVPAGATSAPPVQRSREGAGPSAGPAVAGAGERPRASFPVAPTAVQRSAEVGLSHDASARPAGTPDLAVSTSPHDSGDSEPVGPTVPAEPWIPAPAASAHLAVTPASSVQNPFVQRRSTTGPAGQTSRPSDHVPSAAPPSSRPVASGPTVAVGPPLPVQRIAAHQTEAPSGPSSSSSPLIVSRQVAANAPGSSLGGGTVSFATMSALLAAGVGVSSPPAGESGSAQVPHPAETAATDDGFTSVQLQSADTATAPSGSASEPPPSAPSPAAALAPAPAGAAPTDLDEMARRLYEPLSARLRAELWLDRERAGVMSDA